MQAYTYVEKGKFALLEKPKPVLLHERDAIVKVMLASICSSDLHIKHGSVPRAVPSVTVGHEMVGVVEETGPDVRTLRPGDRSGLNISPSEEIKSVVSTRPNVIRVENASGFWTAIAVSSGTSDVVVTDQHGKTAALTLTVVDGKQGASIPESDASQTDAARQEIVRLVNQVRRENGAPELTVNAALMDAAQHCASLRVAYHQNKVECEAVAASGYPHGFGSNITAFANVPASEIAGRAVENWRNSPGHFQTMVDPDCDTIGVGISTDEGGTICFLFVGDPNAHNPYA